MQFYSLVFFSPTKCESVGGIGVSEKMPQILHGNFLITQGEFELAKRIHYEKLRSSHPSKYGGRCIYCDNVVSLPKVSFVTCLFSGFQIITLIPWSSFSVSLDACLPFTIPKAMPLGFHHTWGCVIFFAVFLLPSWRSFQVGELLEVHLVEAS